MLTAGGSTYFTVSAKNGTALGKQLYVNGYYSTGYYASYSFKQSGNDLAICNGAGTYAYLTAKDFFVAGGAFSNGISFINPNGNVQSLSVQDVKDALK